MRGSCSALVADQRGLLGAGGPAGHALVEAHLDPADELAVHGRCRAEHETVSAHEVDQARVAARGLGGDVDDARQDGVDLERREDRVDDRAERDGLVPGAYVHIAHCNRRRSGSGVHCWPHGGAAISLAHGHRDVSFRGRDPRRARRAGSRVRLRAVRRHARQAERQAGARRAPRRPVRRRRGLRRLRGRRHRPGAARSGHRRDARSALADLPAVEAGGRALRLRRHRRGRGLAVLPAHDPAQPTRPREGAGLRVQDGLRARVLPDPPARRRVDRARRPARHARPALLRHARADALARLRHRRRPSRQRARLGHLRDRPRGRERAVRAELHVRRRARHVRPRDLLPLHGRVARAGARADRRRSCRSRSRT